MTEPWRVSGTPEEIINEVHVLRPEVEDVLDRVRRAVPYIKREISEYQAAALYYLVRGYDFEGARLLEIGTAWGYSAAVMAEAAPSAQIVTLNQPKPAEHEQAVKHLRRYENVEALQICSWDYLELSVAAGDVRTWDLVFVDGDHQQVKRDLAYWDYINPGGLILFHDYSPEGSWRPTPKVYEVVNGFRGRLGRDFDVLVVDDRDVGMAGWVKESE